MPKKTENSFLKQSGRQRKSQANQSTLEQCLAKSQLSEEDFEGYVNKCVRYFIYRAGSNIPIRKNDIQKDALQNAGRQYERIMTEVTRILKDVYGYNLKICEATNNTKTYILRTDLPEIKLHEEDEYPDDIHKVLVMLVLTHVFMSNNSVGEVSLFSFLKSLDIDIEKEHKLFGDVKHFINAVMTKQKYLVVEVDPLSRKNTYNWGQRAETTVSKEQLLNFACKIYKNKQTKSFQRQFENAKQQSLENQEVQGETND